MPNVNYARTGHSLRATFKRPVPPGLRGHRSKRNGQTSSSGIAPAVQPTELSGDGSRTYRMRQHSNKSLPLPAILDPIAIAAKERHKSPKARSKDELTDFQKELALNPYAHALASPVRRCLLTKVHLPSHFLLPFISEVKSRQSEDGKTKILAELLPRAGSRSNPSPASYLLGNRELVKQLSKQSRWVCLVNERMRIAYALKAQKRAKSMKAKCDWIWDEDMADVILRKLREDVLRNLKSCLAQDEAKLLISADMDSASASDAACVLYTAPSTGARPSLASGHTAYDLTKLLADGQLQEFKDECNLRDLEALALRKDHRTVRTALSLLKLQSYCEESRR